MSSSIIFFCTSSRNSFWFMMYSRASFFIFIFFLFQGSNTYHHRSGFTVICTGIGCSESFRNLSIILLIAVVSYGIGSKVTIIPMTANIPAGTNLSADRRIAQTIIAVCQIVALEIIREGDYGFCGRRFRSFPVFFVHIRTPQ